ncbi:MAG: Bug family tripartite tricarboxylate transporter substrate binding protein [Rhizomicrobium sp.]
MRPTLFLWFAAIAATLVAPAPARAEYPDHLIKVVMGFPAGGGADILVRWYVDKLKDITGQPVIIENKPGAGANIATDTVAKAKPDGYTLLMGPSSSLAGNIFLYKNLPFDPVKDLVPVNTLAQVSFVLTINQQKNPAKNLGEFVQLMKAKGDKMTYGIPTTTSQACAALFLAATGLHGTPVAYKTMQAALSDVSAQQIDFVMSDTPYSLAQEKQGKVKILGVATPKRSPAAPEIPTFAEQGVKDADLPPWWAAYAPANTPPEIVQKLANWFNQINAMPETTEYMVRQGGEPLPGTPEGTKKKLADEIALWQKIIKIGNFETQQ